MGDSITTIVLIVVVIPVVVAVLFGVVAMRNATPLVFRCVRCEHMFQQPPHRRFPRICPRCHAPDWSSPAP